MPKRIILWSKHYDILDPSNTKGEFVKEADVPAIDQDLPTYEELVSDDIKPIHGVITNLGLIPVRPIHSLHKIFNYWLGETSFNLNAETILLIRRAEGVDSLDIYSRYKFRIAVGNCFTFQEVKQNIEKVLMAGPFQQEPPSLNTPALDEDTALKVKSTIDLHLKNYKFWAILVLPNNMIEFTQDNTNSEVFQDKLKTFRETKKLVGGTLIEHLT